MKKKKVKKPKKFRPAKKGEVITIGPFTGHDSAPACTPVLDPSIKLNVK